MSFTFSYLKVRCLHCSIQAAPELKERKKPEAATDVLMPLPRSAQQLGPTPLCKSPFSHLIDCLFIRKDVAVNSGVCQFIYLVYISSR